MAFIGSTRSRGRFMTSYDVSARVSTITTSPTNHGAVADLTPLRARQRMPRSHSFETRDSLPLGEPPS